MPRRFFTVGARHAAWRFLDESKTARPTSRSRRRRSQGLCSGAFRNTRPGDFFDRPHDNLSRVDEEVVPVLYVEDATRAVNWYERLGFKKEWEHQFEPGLPWFVSVVRGHVRLFLSEH